MTQDYSYKTSNNELISITTFGNESIESRDCIFFVHGFKGFKDWGFGPYLAKYLAAKGFFVVTFNFSHNGVHRPVDEFTQLDKFSQNTYSLEVKELKELLNAYRDGFFGNVESTNKIGLLGHSRGGGISIVSASVSGAVNALVTWSSISKFDRFTERQKKEWRKNGMHEIINARTKQVMKLSISLLDDIEKNGEDLLNLEEATKKLNIPYLIIHGEQDLAVRLDEAEQIYSWSNKSITKFETIPKTGHTFDVKHPFEGSNEKFDRVLEMTAGFFTDALIK